MARRSRDEWAELVEESRRSGMSQSAFCREAGVSVGALQYWIRKFREDGLPADDHRSIRLLPLTAMPAAADEGLEVLLPNGVQLRFPPRAEAGYVASVVSALGA